MSLFAQKIGLRYQTQNIQSWGTPTLFVRSNRGAIPPGPPTTGIYEWSIETNSPTISKDDGNDTQINVQD